ncbi:MAG: endolytic transglycosylase MltG [Acidobacteria bacterium]|nr:MAG: endolytic transglycosylase MltG [Acidobacteriota bacterium]
MRLPGKGVRILAILALACVCAVLALVITWHLVSSPYKGFSSAEVFVYIPKGTSVPQIGRLLGEAGVIAHPRLFGWYVRLLYPTSSLKAGEYRFDRASSIQAVADKLLKGQVYVVKVTVPEGFSRTEVVDLLVRSGIGNTDALLKATQDTAAIAQLDRQAPDLEGYLFPETYFFSRRVPEKEVVRTMVSGFLRIWTPERQQKARELNMTVREVLTLASLVEKETALPTERQLVSAVFHNRLLKNIPLASDPTIIYGVKQIKDYDGVINKSDLRLDSPYNTYLYSGLPPGPIASPGLAAIDAALDPAKVDFLFFVSRNDGSHLFTVDYRDHMRGVQQYQR